MGWIGLFDAQGGQFDPDGLTSDGMAPDALRRAIPEAALVPQGTLLIETRLTPRRGPNPLLIFRLDGQWPLQITLQALPGGGLSLVIANGQDLQHVTVSHAETGRTDLLRLTYAWDAPGQRGFVAVENTESGDLNLQSLRAPRPVPLRDLRALALGEGHLSLSEDVAYLAIADHVDCIGPAPGLYPTTPVETPEGPVAIGRLQRGDIVLTDLGRAVPVLARIDRVVPARGAFAPVLLRAPFFGLWQDIMVSPQQKLLMRGNEVEYLFGHEAVLVPASHLSGASAAGKLRVEGTIRYSQLLLPEHESIEAAGTLAESLHIGRLRRKPRIHAASALADIPAASLPDHGPTLYPVLRAYDAQVLADYRAA